MPKRLSKPHRDTQQLARHFLDHVDPSAELAPIITPPNRAQVGWHHTPAWGNLAPPFARYLLIENLPLAVREHEPDAGRRKSPEQEQNRASDDDQ